jgi:MbtH protein
MAHEEVERDYVVVKNDEDQYSIWPADLQVPPGCTQLDKRRLKAECLEYVDRVWTDLRPRSLRLRTNFSS